MISNNKSTKVWKRFSKYDRFSPYLTNSSRSENWWSQYGNNGMRMEPLMD
jgi:hypothetical protein